MYLSEEIQFKKYHQFRRDKGLTLELIAGLCELLGMNSQLAKTDAIHINSVEAPAVMF